MLLGKSES